MFTFIGFGDPQNHTEVCRQIIDRVIEEEADFCLILGDLVNDGNDAALWERVRLLCRPLEERFPIYPVPGSLLWTNSF